MTHFSFRLCAALLGGLMLVTPATAWRVEEPPSRFAETDGPIELYWADLMPEGEEEILIGLYQAALLGEDGELIEEGAMNDVMVQIGTFNVVEDLADTEVRLPGFAVPLDFSAREGVREFLLVPSFGQCLHLPPPPPNQTVFVRSEKPIKLSSLSDAVYVEGLLKLERVDSELAGSAYVIEADLVTRFDGRRRH